MKIELFYVPGCTQCTTVEPALKAAAQRAAVAVEWRDVNVLDELDYAVEVGVLTLPAMAIDGQLVFSSLPTPTQLSRALARLSKRKT